LDLPLVTYFVDDKVQTRVSWLLHRSWAAACWVGW